MMDSDLAELYQVNTKRLNEQVKRNAERFPDDFMFRLSKEEFEILRSQFAISSWGGRRYPPQAFTEQGVAMLSSVLHSQRAIEVNVAIMRTFVRLRNLLSTNEELARKVKTHDKQIATLFAHLRKLLKNPKRKQIGFGRSEIKD